MRHEIDDLLREIDAHTLLLYSESYNNPNMYYLTRILVPDPFILIKKIDEPPIMIINDMEFPRAQTESIINDVRSYSDYDYFKIVKKSKDPELGVMKFIASVVASEIDIDKAISIPPDFPSMVTDALRGERLELSSKHDITRKARETKDPSEVEEIRKMQTVVEEVTRDVIALISESDVGPSNEIVGYCSGTRKTLTSGNIKSFIGHRLLDQWCSVENELIVACGPPSSNPHYTGNPEDQIKANQPIILDLYPRSIKQRYYTDMTRTVVKGKASREIRSMFAAVLEAKNASIDALEEGASASEVFSICCEIFEKKNYGTSMGGKRIKRGFLHSLGHGVGLQIHEIPVLSELSKFVLRENSVVTIEPGLYDPKVGGVRLEDIVLISNNGCVNFTKIPCELEI